MPWSPERKAQTRNRILKSAADLFTQQGFEKVSINQIMHNAGLTRGAFYQHFQSKSELYCEAIIFGAQQASTARRKEAVDIGEVIDNYLSREHMESTSSACPLAFLVSDITHQESLNKASYTRVLKNLIKGLEKEAGQTTDEAIISSILMIGGVALARATENDEISDKILSAARQQTRKLIKTHRCKDIQTSTVRDVRV